MISKRLYLVAALAGAAIALPGAVHAQDALPRHMSAAIGLMQYELQGNGFAPAAAIRAGKPIGNVIVAQVSLLGARPDSDPGGSSLFLLPEAQLQLTLPFTRFQPYVGLGTGAALNFIGGDEGTHADLTISGSLGVQTWLGERLGVVIEFRGRGIGTEFKETTSEYTGGLLWRL